MTSKYFCPSKLSSRSSLKIALIYLLIGGGWILISDSLLSFVNNQELATILSMIKGWVFVAVTAVILYQLIQKQIAGLEFARFLIDTTGTGYVVLDSEGRVLDANKEYLGFLGFASLHEITGHCVTEWTAEYDVQRNAEEVAKCLANGYVRNLEIDYQTSDQKIVTVEINATVQRDRRGAKIITLCRDITERKRIQDSLRRNEEQFVKTFNLTPIMIAISTIDEGKYIEVNDLFLKKLGFAREEVIGKTSTELNVIADPSQRAVIVSEVQKNGYVSDYELSVRKRDGRILVGLFSAQIIELQNNKYFLTTFNDITERMHVEEELRKSEERYRAVVTDQTELIARFTADGTLLFVNDMYCNFFAKTKDELIGSKWQPHVLTDDIPSIEYSLSKLSVHNPVAVIENRAISGSGEVRWLQFVNRAFFDQNGTLTETQSVGRDITERKQAEDTLRSYSRRMIELEEAMRKKLAAELHDDIGQDLTALGINCSLIRNSLKKQIDEKLDARFDDSLNLIKQITRTVRGIISLLRPPVLDDYGLKAAVQWFGEIFEKRSGIKVCLNADETFPRFSVDNEMLLFRIIQEALTNVSKHAAAQHAEIRLSHVDNMIVVTVVDDGTGFEPSGDKCRMGWGLTIMKERAESAGGIFVVESAPGQGTRISVSLPEPSNRTGPEKGLNIYHSKI